MYIIEGNIGAGKSTLLRLIHEYIPEVLTIDEPVNTWQGQLYGQSLLTNFYEQPQRWAYTFELLTLISRIKEHAALATAKNQVHVMERSIFSGFYCFAKNSHRQGFMTDIEWRLYQEWFNFLVSENKAFYPQGFIYLRVAPEIAYNRIKKRNRHAEKTMSLRYLKQIHDQHESFLVEKNDVIPALKTAPVLTLDCDLEFETDEKTQTDYINSIKQFCNISASSLNQHNKPPHPVNFF